MLKSLGDGAVEVLSKQVVLVTIESDDRWRGENFGNFEGSSRRLAILAKDLDGQSINYSMESRINLLPILEKSFTCKVHVSQ